MMKTTLGALALFAIAAYAPAATAQHGDKPASEKAGEMPEGDERAGFLRKRPSKIERDDTPVIEADETVGFLRKRPSKIKPEADLPQGDDRAGFLRKRPSKVKPEESQPGPDTPQGF